MTLRSGAQGPILLLLIDPVSVDSGRCDAITSDIAQLLAQKTTLKKPNDHAVLGEVMSKEPLGPAVRHGDDQWLDIVKWVAFGLSQAEEFGITSANLGEFTSSPLNLERGVNTLWTQGGLLYSPPFR